MPGSDDNKRQHSRDEIENWNLDRTVDPPTKVVGILGKNSSGSYEYISSENRRLMISGSFSVTANTSPLSADSSAVSAKQEDASNLRVSAFSNDAGLMRVSAVGGSTVSLSADASGNRVSAVQADAANLNISAKSGDGSTFRISALSPDASTFRVSAIGVSVSTSPLSADSSSISAKQADASNLRVSAIIDSGSISAKGTVSAFINQGTVSAYSPDAALFRISGIGTFIVSSHEVKQSDAASLRISAIIDSGSISAKGTLSAFINEGSISARSGDANQLHVSAVQGDSGLFRVSSHQYPDTTGGLTVFRSQSVSASQNVKSSAGSIYGYYAFNSDTKVNYLKFYNVSGAVNLGTDTPLFVFPLPISGGANRTIDMGIAGFTNGIGIAATSGAPDDNTAAPAASAVALTLFYK